ncbi:hypothetical protein ACKLTP_18545, partial [Paenarthrobacter ureafaciens]
MATIAAGLAAIAGNFASLPQPGTTWQSSWFNLLGLANIIVLLVMWWWKVPVLSSLQADRKTTSAASLRSDPGTPGAARISVSLGPVVGIHRGLHKGPGAGIRPRRRARGPHGRQ